MSVEELRRIPLFDGLDDVQLGQLDAISHEIAVAPGQELWTEGQPADTWWVLLDGTVNLLKRVGNNEETVVGAMSNPGQWAGGFAAWDPNARCFATGRAAAQARILEVPAAELKKLGDEWFAFGVHFIRGLVDTVRRVESTARQREALVALGTLAAGLAHEINNPAAAATRAVDSLTVTSAALESSLMRLMASGISPEQLDRLETLRHSQGDAPAPDRLAAADREDELSDWLADHGVDEGWLLAPALAAAGMDTAWCDEVAQDLGPDAVAPAIEWVAHSLVMSSLLSEVKDSTGRISSLVGAVRSYSQLDRSGVQPVDVVEGLESTLTMLAYKLKNVTVERDLAADLPPVDAFPGELNQVWTNLIDNAVDAMDGVGTLRVSAQPGEAGKVVVTIEDTGPGMPAEVQARAFEPFFTTKEVGKGTGLGLDISRRIVEDRHFGEIAIDSRPGKTTMQVSLPPRGQEQAGPD